MSEAPRVRARKQAASVTFQLTETEEERAQEVCNEAARNAVGMRIKLNK